MTAPTLHQSPWDALLSKLVYDSTYYLAAAGMTLGWSLRTEGRQHIPATGPALLIANHQSYLDPLLVGLGTRRHLCYLARKTLFKKPFFTWLIRMLNAVPVDQEGIGKDGIKTILNQLHEGQAVVVFPEGERTHNGQLQPLRPGIHLLIKRTQAPIVPVGIAGAFDALPRWGTVPLPAPLFWPGCRATLAVSIGEPLAAQQFAQMPRQRVLEELFEAMKKVWQRAERLRAGQDRVSRIKRQPVHDVETGVGRGGR